MPDQISPITVQAVSESNYKLVSEMGILESQRNVKSTNGILEVALANSLQRMQTLDVGEAAAISGVIRSDLTPHIATLAGAVSSLRTLLAGTNTGQPSE